MIKYEIEVNHITTDVLWSNKYPTDCHSLIVSYVIIIGLSAWILEVFYLVRAWKLAMDSSHVFGKNDFQTKCHSILCKCGLVGCVFGCVSGMTCMMIFIDYKANDNEKYCSSKDAEKNKQLIMAVVGNVFIYSLVCMFALIGFIQPLVRYKLLIKEYNTGNEVVIHSKIEVSLSNTIKRVCWPSIVTHVSIIVCTVICVWSVLQEDGSSGENGHESGGAWVLRSIFACLNVVQIILMDFTFSDWKQRIFPFGKKIETYFSTLDNTNT